MLVAGELAAAGATLRAARLGCGGSDAGELGQLHLVQRGVPTRDRGGQGGRVTAAAVTQGLQANIDTGPVQLPLRGRHR